MEGGNTAKFLKDFTRERFRLYTVPYLLLCSYIQMDIKGGVKNFRRKILSVDINEVTDGLVGLDRERNFVCENVCGL